MVKLVSPSFPFSPFIFPFSPLLSLSFSLSLALILFISYPSFLSFSFTFLIFHFPSILNVTRSTKLRSCSSRHEVILFQSPILFLFSFRPGVFVSKHGHWSWIGGAITLQVSSYQDIWIHYNDNSYHDGHGYIFGTVFLGCSIGVVVPSTTE